MSGSGTTISSESLLLAELEHREPRAAVALHRTAARWFEREGLTSDVLRHLMAAGDVARAAEVAAAGWWPHYLGGRVWTARRWLDLFTSDQLADHIPLRVAAAWIHALTGDASAARGLITGLDLASLDSVPSYDRAVSPRSSVALLRALLASDGPFRMREDALEAVRREEGGTGPWAGFAGSCSASPRCSAATTTPPSAHCGARPCSPRCCTTASTSPLSAICR